MCLHFRWPLKAVWMGARPLTFWPRGAMPPMANRRKPKGVARCCQMQFHWRTKKAQRGGGHGKAINANGQVGTATKSPGIWGHDKNGGTTRRGDAPKTKAVSANGIWRKGQECPPHLDGVRGAGQLAKWTTSSSKEAHKSGGDERWVWPWGKGADDWPRAHQGMGNTHTHKGLPQFLAQTGAKG